VVKFDLTWWTKSSRQHEMMASHDRVLTAIREALRRRVADPSHESKAQAA